VACLPARWLPVFSLCFAQPHPSGLKRDANTTGCSSLLADSLDTLSRGSSSFHCNHSANTRASDARTAANLQPPFVERSLVLHNCILSRRQSIDSFPDSLAQTIL